MGIDFSHGNAAWSYRRFHSFRTRLAQAIGMDLAAMKGFGGNQDWPLPRSEPCLYLLNHSDCDGHLTPSQCRKLAPRLRQIVNNWPDDDYDKRQALRLADGMDTAAQECRNLRFM